MLKTSRITIIDKIKNYIPKDNRSNKIAKNVIAMIVIKGVGILISFLLVPMTIHYVNSSTYGIWLTLSSIVAWMSFFNIGLNSSLRNKFAEAKATGKYEKAQSYVSTTYIMLGIIFGSVLVLFTIIFRFIDWNKLLNVYQIDSVSLSVSVIIVVAYFCIKFVLSTVDQILLADQKPAVSSCIGLIENVISLLIIFILTKTTQGSLTNLCIGLCISPIIVLFVINIIMFTTKYKLYAPKFSMFDASAVKELLTLGVKFFVISISGIILYQTTNFIIIRWFSPENVTEYNIAFKYFSMLNMAFSILITPLWSATTDAFAKGEIEWIRNTVNKYIKILLLFMFTGLIMLIISNWFYNIWIGDEIQIPFKLSIMVLLYVMVMICGGLFVHVLNGMGYVKIQFYSSLISPIIFISLCYLFVKILNWGFFSIILATIIANFNGFLLAPLQYYMIFYKDKSGLWKK